MFYEKYLYYLRLEVEENTIIETLENKDTSQLILIFDKSDNLVFQNKEIPANLKYKL